MNQVTHSLNSADISIFSPKIRKLCSIKKCRYRLRFDNMVTIFMSVKMATSGLLEVKVKDAMTSSFLSRKYVGPGCSPFSSPVKNNLPITLVDAYANN